MCRCLAPPAFSASTIIRLDQSFSTQGTPSIFYRRDLIIKTNNMIVFKSSIGNILIAVLVLKTTLIVDFDDFLFLKIFSLFFGLPPNSLSTPADPSGYISVPRDTGCNRWPRTLLRVDTRNKLCRGVNFKAATQYN